MAATPTWDDVRELAEYRAQKGCAISFYVDLDPVRSPTPRDTATRVNALLADGHKDALRREQSHEEKEALKRDFQRLERYFEHDFQRDGSRGLAVFCAGLDGMWIDLQLPDPVPDGISVQRGFYLAPSRAHRGPRRRRSRRRRQPRARQPLPAARRTPAGGDRPERGAASAPRPGRLGAGPHATARRRARGRALPHRRGGDQPAGARKPRDEARGRLPGGTARRVRGALSQEAPHGARRLGRSRGARRAARAPGRGRAGPGARA